jgi:hypothetical protein
MPEPCFGYAYNPPVFVNDCCGWFADVEFLYLKPVQEGISPGATGGASGVSPITTPILVETTTVGLPTADFSGKIDERFHHPHYDWDSGFRVGLGYRLPCDCWEVSAIFTHYRTNCCNNENTSFLVTPAVETTRRATLNGTLFAPSYSIYREAVSPFDLSQIALESEWRLNWNQVDLQFSREFYVGRCVTLRPHTGLRALFLEEKYHINQFASGITGVAPIAGEIASVRETIRMQNNFKGIGVLAGLDMAFDFGCGLAFYGEATGSLNFGKYRTTQQADGALNTFLAGRGTATPTLGGLTPNSLHIKDDLDDLLANLDLKFGIRWRNRMNCDRNAFTLKLGWENHVFFGYNRFRNTVAPTFNDVVTNSPTGNLSLYGIVFAAVLDF